MRLSVDLPLDDKNRDEWTELINQWVHDEINRKILIRRLLDGISLDEISVELNFERRQLSRRYKKALLQLSKHC